MTSLVGSSELVFGFTYWCFGDILLSTVIFLFLYM